MKRFDGWFVLNLDDSLLSIPDHEVSHGIQKLAPV
jgi:hypothetical protein